MPLKKTDLAYAAGIIDGEGCIRTTRQNGYVSIRVHVTNTDARLTHWMHQSFGGYIWEESRAYAANAKIRYVWEVSASRAAIFLLAVRPFLKLKAERADLALAIQHTKRRGRSPSKADIELREHYAGKIRLLNKKGVA